MFIVASSISVRTASAACIPGYLRVEFVIQNAQLVFHAVVQLGCPFTRRTMKTKLRKAHAFTTDPHNSQGSHFSSAANSGVHTGISNTNDAEQGCSPAGKNLMSPAHVQHDMHDMKYAHHLDERAGTGGPKPGSEFKLLTEDTVWQLRPKQKLRKIPGDVVQRSAQHGCESTSSRCNRRNTVHKELVRGAMQVHSRRMEAL